MASATVAFRVDAAEPLRLGRCLALAARLRSLGAKVVFVLSAELSPPWRDALRDRGVAVRAIEPDCDGWQRDAEDTLEVLDAFGAPAWLAVDHAGLGAGWETRVWGGAQRIMVIDHLADRSHECHLFLDDTPALDANARQGAFLRFNVNRLLGPAYAPLMPGFAEAGVLREAGEGGGGGVLLMANSPAEAEAVALPEAGVAVPGPLGAASVEGEARLELRLLAADVAVSVGGCGLLEAMCAGVPTVAILAGGDERRNLAAAGGCLAVGGAEEALAALRFLEGNAPLAQALADAGRRLVDGRGLERIAGAMLG